MKNIHLILLTLICIGSGTILHAQANGGFATARIYEGAFNDVSRIMVAYENGQTEVIGLKDLVKLKTVEEINLLFLENQKIINKFLDGMAIKGYEIVTMSQTTETYLGVFIIFRKKK